MAELATIRRVSCLHLYLEVFLQELQVFVDLDLDPSAHGFFSVTRVNEPVGPLGWERTSVAFSLLYCLLTPPRCCPGQARTY